MARVLYCHPSRTKHEYHIFTDLDFWDSRRLLKDLVTVKRNFGESPHGDEFPTQVTGEYLSKADVNRIEYRLKKAIISPPRHVVVRCMVFDGYFEFDPGLYYPERWSRSQMIHFTYHRLPLRQSALNSPYHTIMLSWSCDQIRIDRRLRDEKYDAKIQNDEDVRRRMIVPSCF